MIERAPEQSKAEERSGVVDDDGIRVGRERHYVNRLLHRDVSCQDTVTLEHSKRVTARVPQISSTRGNRVVDTKSQTSRQSSPSLRSSEIEQVPLPPLQSDMASSSPAPEAPNKPSLKALGKRKALTPNLSDDDLPLSKRATLSQPPSSSSTYDATQLTSRQVTNVTSSSPNKVAAAPKEDTATESDDEIQIIRSPRRKVVDLGDDDDTNEVENKVKENDQGEMTLAPFYSTTCPICLGQPSPLVVTKCGHTLFACLSLAIVRSLSMVQLWIMSLCGTIGTQHRPIPTCICTRSSSQKRCGT